MPARFSWTIAVLIAVVALSTPLPAQWREGSRPGMFGERELGKPLKPRTSSRFSGGLERGPSGNFLGRTTGDRSTTFQPRTPAQAAEPSWLPPEAYNLEPEMVPGFLEDQARRMAIARDQILQQQQQLQQSQQPALPQQQPLPYQGPVEPSFPPPAPVMPERPDRYLPPAWSTQPGLPPAQPGLPQGQPVLPQPEPGVPGPAGGELKNSPDRWFRGAPTAAEQQAATANPATAGAAMAGQRYAPPLGSTGAGSLGPSGLAGRPGLSRSGSVTLGARIGQALGGRALSPIAATVQGDTVTLQGTVATAADRQFAERMAALEPGVRRIDNRIRVEPTLPVP